MAYTWVSIMLSSCYEFMFYIYSAFHVKSINCCIARVILVTLIVLECSLNPKYYTSSNLHCIYSIRIWKWIFTKLCERLIFGMTCFKQGSAQKCDYFFQLTEYTAIWSETFFCVCCDIVLFWLPDSFFMLFGC